MSPMDEFNQTVESEQEVGYLDILASLMNGKHRYHSTFIYYVSALIGSGGGGGSKKPKNMLT